MSYTAGDTVVHPQHGTVTVAGIVSKDVGAGPADYLELYVEGRSLKIMVPADAVDEVGIRKVATKEEAEVILALLEEPSFVPEGWSERNVSTVARMKSHDLEQVSMVVRDLSRHQLRTAKPLTMRERDLLEGCLDMVARELSLALDMPREDAKALIVEKSLSGAAMSSDPSAVDAPSGLG